MQLPLQESRAGFISFLLGSEQKVLYLKSAKFFLLVPYAGSGKAGSRHPLCNLGVKGCALKTPVAFNSAHSPSAQSLKQTKLHRNFTKL
jgi:hypothetical protein